MNEEGTDMRAVVDLLHQQLRESDVPFTANDSIASQLSVPQKAAILAEVTKAVESMLYALVIDTKKDHNTKGTALRIAKMYVQEVFKGRYELPPAITEFPNAKNLDELYITGPITIRSTCSHHFAPIIGKCWIGIVPTDKVIGLSKFNRLVDWIASRPQIQEELVMQIADEIETRIRPAGLAVVIKAQHMCMTWRGVKEDVGATMTTSVMRGTMKSSHELRSEFLSLIKE